MAYDPGAIDSALAAAVGDEPGLIAELRIAFVESAERTVVALERSASAEDWRTASARLKGLAASFGAVRLMALATEAADKAGDAELLAKIKRAVARL